MKKLLIISGVTAIAAFSANTFAASPAWNFVEGAYVKADIEGEDFESEPDGFGATASFLLNENIFVMGKYSRLSDDIRVLNGDVDMNYNQASLGLGYRHPISATTDIFGAVSYEYIELEADGFGQSDSTDEDGYGLAGGIRSMLTNNVELNGTLAYVDIDDESETSLGLSAYYYFNTNFAAGLGYTFGDEADTYQASLRYAF